LKADTLQEEREEQVRLGTEAEAIFKHPLLQGFFEVEAKKAFAQFCALSLNSTHEQCLAVIAKANAIGNLSNSLKKHIGSKQYALERDLMDKENEGA